LTQIILQSLRLVSSLAWESLLLLAVASGSLLSALKANSQLMAIYSITMATASIIMSGPSLLSDISILYIAITSAILGNRLSWRKLFSFGLAASYIGHLYCCATAVGAHGQDIASLFLSAIWLVFSVGFGYSVQSNQKGRRFTTTLSCLNAISLVGGLTLINGTHLAEKDQLILVGGGLIYLAISRWLHKRCEDQLTVVHSLLGLSLIDIAKVIHFSGQPLLSADIMERFLLATLGARFGIRSFRWFAVFMSGVILPLLGIGIESSTMEQTHLGFHSFPLCQDRILRYNGFGGGCMSYMGRREHKTASHVHHSRDTLILCCSL
jgi:hypothetical protein